MWSGKRVSEERVTVVGVKGVCVALSLYSFQEIKSALKKGLCVLALISPTSPKSVDQGRPKERPTH